MSNFKLIMSKNEKKNILSSRKVGELDTETMQIFTTTGKLKKCCCNCN